MNTNIDKTLLQNSIRVMNEFSNLPFEEQYVYALYNILENGTVSEDRTGTGTKRIQSQKITIDLNKGFPILRGKKMNFKNALVEMVWIMSGRNDLKFLKDNGVNYWDSWVKEDGTFGPIYGPQMRNFNGVDQLNNIINELIKNPDSRRLVVNLWNPVDNDEMALTCCHHDYQLSSFIDVDGVRKLDLHVKQRSADCFLGVPYDFMLFAIYLELICWFVGIQPNKIHITMADFHMYLNHEEQVKQYIENYLTDNQKLITESNTPYSIFENFLQDYSNFDALLQSIIDNNFEKYKVLNYNPYPFIKAEVAV